MLPMALMFLCCFHFTLHCVVFLPNLFLSFVFLPILPKFTKKDQIGRNHGQQDKRVVAQELLKKTVSG